LLGPKNWEGNMTFATSAAVTSTYNSLNNSSLINDVLYIVQAVLLSMNAKFSDMIGRTEAYVIVVLFYINSGITQTAAPNMNILVASFFYR
jgi:hypothetical protein